MSPEASIASPFPPWYESAWTADRQTSFQTNRLVLGNPCTDVARLVFGAEEGLQQERSGTPPCGTAARPETAPLSCAPVLPDGSGTVL